MMRKAALLKRILAFGLTFALVASEMEAATVYAWDNVCLETYGNEQSEEDILKLSDDEILLSETEQVVLENDILTENYVDSFGDMVSDTEAVEVISVNIISDTEIPETTSETVSELSQEEIDAKKALITTYNEMGKYTEGIDYAANEVFSFVENIDLANEVANLIDASLKEFESGVAVYTLNGSYSVDEVVAMSLDISNNLPALYPNYNRDCDDINGLEAEYEVAANGSYIYDTVLNINDRLLDESTATKSGNSAYQWFHDAVGSGYAWSRGYKGYGIKVAVIDSGVNPHEDLVVKGNYGLGGDESIEDLQGHGTHVAGIIGARINGRGGVGIAPEADIYNIKVYSETTKKISDSAAVMGIEKAISLGVDIINISFGSAFINSAYDEVMTKAYRKGIAVFAAAGNDGGQVIYSPAYSTHVFSVAATDANNKRANFSNYGEWIDFAAPGSEIWSTYNSSNSSYAGIDGTSMAAPIVAGEAAVILSAAKDIPELQDAKGNLLKGSNRVDALVSVMKKNTVNAGNGMGSGICYLPKVFKTSNISSIPSSPTIEIASVTSAKNKENALGTMLKMDFIVPGGCMLVYSVDGKNPTFKNGVCGSNTKLLTVSSEEESNKCRYSVVIPKSEFTKRSVNVKAATVSPVGKLSKVVSKTYKFEVLPGSVEIKGTQNYASAGKSITLKATVFPTNATNKKVSWNIDDKSKAAGIKISNGKVTIPSNFKGYCSVLVTAAAVGDTSKIDTYEIEVVPSNVAFVTSIRPKASKVNKCIGNAGYSFDGFELFEIGVKDGYTASATDFTWKSLDTSIATVTPETGNITVKKDGKVKISVAANDGSMKTSSCTITVYRNCDSINMLPAEKSNSMNLIAGRYYKLKTNLVPENATKKSISYAVSAEGLANGLSVTKTGCIKATSKAALGTYDVFCEVVNMDGTKTTSKIAVNIIAKGISSLRLKSKKETIFRTTNNFACKTDVTIPINYSGNAEATDFAVTSSNPGIVGVSPVYKEGDLYVVSCHAIGGITGKAKVKVTTLDGSNKSSTATVTVVNPPSSLKILRKDGKNTTSLYAGGKVSLAAVIGSEYGRINNTGVAYSLEEYNPNGVKVENAGSNLENHASITASGALTIGKNIANYTKLRVTAKLKDGSNVSVVRDFYVYKVLDANTFGTTKQTTLNLNGKSRVDKEIVLNLPTDMILGYGESAQLRCAKFRASATNPTCVQGYVKGYSFDKNNHSYARVSFVLTGTKAGSGNVSFTTDDGSRTLTYVVTVN